MTYIQPTDYFDRPLAVGDRVVYPVQHGSSAASLNEGIVTGFVALIDHPSGHYPHYLVREDQLNKSDPTKFLKNAHAARPYIVKIQVKTYDDRYINRTIKNVGLIVKGPAV